MFDSRINPRARSILATLILAVAVGACSDDGSTAESQTSSTTARRTSTKVDATRLFVQVATAGQPLGFPPADEAGVLDALGRYVTDAMIAPLEGRDPEIDTHLAPAALLTVTDADRAALSDAGLPPATGPIAVEFPRVNLRALAERDGTITLIGSTLFVEVRAPTKAGPVKISREGQLMFARDGATWKILGFTVAVSRDGAGVGDLPRSTSTTGGAS